MRASKADFYDRSNKVSSGYTGVVRETVSGWEAYRVTRNGIVHMYADRYNGGKAYTTIRLVHAEREYHRTYEAFYGPGWTARLAEQFAAEVVNEGDPQ